MPLPDADFEFIRTLVRREAGISLSDNKSYLVKSRLEPLLEKHKLPSLRNLVQQLKQQPNLRLQNEIIDLMTTNESWFFRDAWPFECMQEFVLPQVLTQLPSSQPLHVWSAACSSGQEPYSLAIIMDQFGAKNGGLNHNILATDLSPSILDQAKQGTFTKVEVSRGLSPAALQKYFRPHQSGYQVTDALKRRIQFMQLNLLKPWPTLPKFNVVFLRNVLIYFDIETKQNILERIAERMTPGGYLFLGAGETMLQMKSRFMSMTYKGNTCYQLN